MAYEASSMCAALAEAFGVAVEFPPSVSKQLKEVGDEMRARG
jgi:hypothetical protein